ncbi:MAG: hypothetical protein JW797_07640 [Bradymonadales bacterium]|nr:hypothetical protein [Bradymonadales bacterium]
MSELFDTVLLLALPASGKSEIRKYLSSLTAEQCREEMHMGPTVQLDDFPYVHFMRCIDDALIDVGRSRMYFEDPEKSFFDRRAWGALVHLLNQDYADLLARREIALTNAAETLFERLDRAHEAVGSPIRVANLDGATRAKVAQAVEAEARTILERLKENYPDTLEGKTIVLEFARGGPHGSSMPLPEPHGYQYSLAHLSEQILSRAVILYVWVTPEESRRKNDARADPNDPGSILHHGVPLYVMMNEYGCDDMEHLMQRSDRPNTALLEAHGRSWHLPVARVDNRVDKTSFIRNDRSQWKPEEVQAIHSELAAATGRLIEAYRNELQRKG